jgi:hypothetical protein
MPCDDSATALSVLQNSRIPEVATLSFWKKSEVTLATIPHSPYFPGSIPQRGQIVI